MLILRLTQSSEGPDRYRIEIALEGGGRARQTAVSTFSFALAPRGREDVRWYLEDFLDYPFDPNPAIAARIERRMRAIGVELFDAIFQSNAGPRDLWATLRGSLNDTRVEIVAGVREATTLPWELLRDPKTDRPLALEAQVFVRASTQTARPPRFTQSAGAWFIGPGSGGRGRCRRGGHAVQRVRRDRRKIHGRSLLSAGARAVAGRGGFLRTEATRGRSDAHYCLRTSGFAGLAGTRGLRSRARRVVSKAAEAHAACYHLG